MEGLQVKTKKLQEILEEELILFSLIALLGAILIFWIIFSKFQIVRASSIWTFSVLLKELKYLTPLTLLAGNIPLAIETVQTERARTRNERNAFKSFINQIKEIPVVQTSSSTLNTQSSIIGIDSKRVEASHLQEVQKVYKSTVMDVEHYENEYGDTVAESLTEEFGSDIATQIMSGRVYSPLLQRQILEAAKQRRAKREQFLATLNTEQDALTTAQAMLEDATSQLDQIISEKSGKQSDGDLINAYLTLKDAEKECETLVDERQQQRAGGYAAMNTTQTSVPDLQSYLYNRLPATYPVIADTMDFISQSQRTRRQLLKNFTSRV